MISVFFFLRKKDHAGLKIDIYFFSYKYFLKKVIKFKHLTSYCKSKYAIVNIKREKNVNFLKLKINNL